MKDSNYFYSQANDLKSDIEVSIAKILRTKKKINCLDKQLIIGEDNNGVRCVLYGDKPLRFYNVDFCIEILEFLEKQDSLV